MASTEPPFLFRCPISMELMLDPVTVSTGVTYDRPNIEKWLFTHRKRTCPATMQLLTSLDLTPNLTLRRLISAWTSAPPPPSAAAPRPQIPDLLHRIQTTPFKLAPLRTLRGSLTSSSAAAAADGDTAKEELFRCGGVEVLGAVLSKVLEESGEFEVLEAAEEAAAVLSLLPLREDREMKLLMKKETLEAIVLLLQRGGAEARLHSVLILQKIARTSKGLSREMGEKEIDLCKPLLELLSDEVSTQASGAALDVLVEVVKAARRAVVKAVEAGAVSTVVELLPEAGKQRCERLLVLLKVLCKCPEGRSAFAEHALGLAAVSKKIMRVSEAATKVSVKILWLVCTMLPCRKVVEEMLMVGAVKKILALLHVGGRSATKEMVVGIVNLHGRAWQMYPCFPLELKEYFQMVR